VGNTKDYATYSTVFFCLKVLIFKRKRAAVVHHTPALVRPTDTLIVLKNPPLTAVWRDKTFIHAAVEE
jgi:hypothetical protein